MNLTITPEELKELFFKAGQLELTAKSVRDAIKPLIVQLIGDKESYTLPDGWRFVKEERQSMQYDVVTLKEILDEDQFATVLEPNKKLVATLLKELDLTPEQSKKIEETMHVVSFSEAIKLSPPAGKKITIKE